MKIVAVFLDDFKMSPALYDFSRSLISPERVQKVDRFHFVEDKIRSIFSELLVRSSVFEEWGIEPELIQFEYNEFGKPSLKNHPDLHFNLSHSGQWVAAALDTSPIGIDVEKVQPIDLTIAERFFTSSETEQILQQPAALRTRYFYKFWTLKESYIKAVGKGLSIPLHSFSFDLSEESISLHTGTKDKTWFFKLYDHLPEYEFAVCSSNKKISIEIQVLSMSELLNTFIN